MKIKTSEFVFSKRAKKLPAVIDLNEEFAYILGLWRADRCSTAKGIVGLRSKNETLLETFEEFLKKIKLKVKKRVVNGYSKTKEVYTCSMPLRRIFEALISNRVNIMSNNSSLVTAYIAGVLDGDGTSSNSRSDTRLYYGIKEIEEAKIDAILIQKLGFNVTTKIYKNFVANYIKNSGQFNKLVSTFSKKLHGLVVRKRARPTSHVATTFSGR
jgi:hypothetical protein